MPEPITVFTSRIVVLTQANIDTDQIIPARFTSPEPGTTIAGTSALQPRTTSAAARRSSMRLLVHEPMKTRSTAMSVMAVPGFRSM